MTASVVSGERRGRSRRPRSRATFTSVLGELLLTAGVLVLLFVAWQMWIGDIIISAQKNDEGAAVSREWAEAPPPALPETFERPDGTTAYQPVIPARPADTEQLGQMHIPRFGSEYNVGIFGGTSRARTLDKLGIGVYTNSKMPGEVGNFAMAGHRTTWGKPFNQLDKLQIGDAIVVETIDGWFTYRFRTLEYVKPTQTDVLLDVPQIPGAQTGEQYITLTACSPLYSLAERIVAYGVFESFQPRAEGPPKALTDPPPPPAAPSI
ncbi:MULTISPECIES: class E sortase [Microbacterium]|jgi:sortase A|uniref:class E sortase n=1 Tax=Microbacterium TaxID=33882 RepID=UPI00203C971E|nr:class E sortase [Microbacterium hydrocarbonoxydans]MCM3778617.1 class E sortase [Microbacterium hydrocarbonoxydans]